MPARRSKAAAGTKSATRNATTRKKTVARRKPAAKKATTRKKTVARRKPAAKKATTRKKTVARKSEQLGAPPPPPEPEETETEALRRRIDNAERLSRGTATPQEDAYETGLEDPVIEEWDPPRVRQGERAALIGRNFFGVRGLLIGGAQVHDLVVVNSRRLEFTVPADSTSTDVVVVNPGLDYTPREPEIELTEPSIERPHPR